MLLKVIFKRVHKKVVKRVELVKKKPNKKLCHNRPTDIKKEFTKFCNRTNQINTD